MVLISFNSHVAFMSLFYLPTFNTLLVAATMVAHASCLHFKYFNCFFTTNVYVSTCVCADLPVGDDQRCGGDPSWYCQQGTHYLWEHAGPLRVSSQVSKAGM